MPITSSATVAAQIASAKEVLRASIKQTFTASEGRTSDAVADEITNAVANLVQTVVSAMATDTDAWGATVLSWANSHTHVTPSGPSVPGSLPPLV